MERTAVSHEEWLKVRSVLLAKEKEFTRQRDAMTAQIRALPWRKIEKSYTFEAATGKQSLSDLFGGKTQLTSTNPPLPLDRTNREV